MSHRAQHYSGICEVRTRVITYLACTYQMLRDGNHVSGLVGLAKDLLLLRARGLPSFKGLRAAIPCVVRKKNSGFSGLRIWQKRPQEAPQASNKYLHMTLCPRATRSHLCSPSDVQLVLRCQSQFTALDHGAPSKKKKKKEKKIAGILLVISVVPGTGTCPE